MKLKRMKKLVAGGVLVLGLIAAAGYTAGRIYADEKKEDVILPNIYIGELAVGGMDEQEATQAVTDYVDTLKDTPFTMTVGDRSMTATAEQLGVTWENTNLIEEALDIGKTGSLITRYKDKKDLEHEPRTLALSYAADETKVSSYLTEHADEVNQDAVDGGLKRENGAFTITEGEEGIAIDIAQSAKEVAGYVENDWDGKAADIALEADIVKPRGSKEQLSRVKDVLATYSTDYSSSNAGRAKNVANGCSRINGTLLYPGDQFSVYEAVSPFDEENGYALAGSYENGTVVETYGGGICQVSTTLYNAVIRAELEIKERYAHSMIVSYVQPSMDAAIAGTYKDLKFVNNTDAPVYIEGATGGGVITFTVYGEETREAGRSVSFESEIVNETQPPTQIQGSADYAVGYVSVQQSAHIGKQAKLWKIVTVDGVEKSREVFNSSNYSASPKIIVVGTKTDNAKAKAAIEGAIAAQDENTIYTAAANAAAIATQPEEPEEPQEEEPGTEPEEKPDKKPEKKPDTDKKAEAEKKPAADKKPDTDKKTESVPDAGDIAE